MSAAGEHVESDRCRTGVRRQTFCIPPQRFASTLSFISMSRRKRWKRAGVANFLWTFFFREKTQQDESNASAVAALRPRARARKRARRVRARPWRRRCVRGRPRKGSTRAARAPRATGPDRGGAPRATRNRATAARRREASRCPAAGGCSCTTSGSSRRSRSGGTTSASRFLASRGGVAAHPTSSSRVRAPASFKCARISTTDKNAAGSFSSAWPVADLGPPRATRSRRHPRSAPLYAERDIDAKRSRD